MNPLISFQQGVLFHQDNAPAHKSVVVMATVCDCGFELVDHPPYSPDLAPSDYYLIPKMKKIIVLVKQDSLHQFPGHSRNVSSSTFQSLELVSSVGLSGRKRCS